MNSSSDEATPHAEVPALRGSIVKIPPNASVTRQQHSFARLDSQIEEEDEGVVEYEEGEEGDGDEEDEDDGDEGDGEQRDEGDEGDDEDEGEGDLGDEGDEGDEDLEGKTNSSGLISAQEFVLRWTDLQGGVHGRKRIRKVCPRGTFIRRMVVVVGNQYGRINGVTRIGQVTCSDGRKLPCCDGGRLRRGDRRFLFQSWRGIRRGRIRFGDTVRGVCLDNGRYWGCAGTDGRHYDFNCVGNRRVRGFQTRSDHNVNALSFLCG